MIIREFNKNTDMDGLKECVIALQDFERELVVSMPRGVDICEQFIVDSFKECKKFAGHILVAIEDGKLAGYVTVYTKMVSDDVSDGDMEFGFISEISVLEAYRQKGFGKKLLAKAEQVAKDSGATTLRIGVLSDNTVATDLYLATGFQPLSMQLEKAL